MHLLSRSAFSEKNKCRRAFLNRYLYRGTGYTEAVPPLPLAIGIAVHEGMEQVMLTARVGEQGDLHVDVEKVLSTAFAAWDSQRPRGPVGSEPTTAEVKALIEALLRGWVRVEAERFFGEYEVLRIEQEGKPIPLSPSFALAFRADVVVRRRWDGALLVINWKTLGTYVKDWTAKWQSEVQAYSEAWATEKELGEPVLGTVMIGLNKGSLRQTAGQAHFSSNLIWGYKKTLPDGTVIYGYDYKSCPTTKDGGWSKFPVWEEEFEGVGKGVEAWVRWLPLHVVAASYMTSEVIQRLPPPLEDDLFLGEMGQQAESDHHVLTEGSERDKLLHFGKTGMGDWNCGTRDEPKCPFRGDCLGYDTIEAMIERGALVPRVDHHAPKEGK
jgi:hypothetical protein